MSVNPLVEKYLGLVEKANAVAKRHIAETGDVSERVENWINTTDNEDVAAYREWLAKTQAQIEKAKAAIAEREANVREAAEAAVSAESDYDAEKGASDFLALRKEITAMRKGFEAFGMDVPETEELVSLKSRTTRQGGDGRGAGVSRSSFSSVVVNGESLEKPTFSTAAGYISKRFGKVTAGELRDSLSSAHGDVSEKVGETFTFSHTVTGKNGETHTLTIDATPTENVRRQAKSDETE